MADLIRREDALSELESVGITKNMRGYRKVASIHSVDAVEVVRCRDCKHRYSDSWCEYVDDDDNFYCARGERKDGDGNG